MKPDYKNWIPKWMLTAGIIGVVLSLILLVVFALVLHGVAKIVLCVIFAIAAVLMCVYLAWSVFAYNAFSYDGKRKVSKRIIDGTAGYIDMPDGGVALDIGCGSGALAIAVAKKNPNANIIGCDRWGKEYASFSKLLCKENARAEGVENIKFRKGDATALPFEDETFDAVMSNYVYHNIPTNDRQAILLETLRTLKKGGTFAIHDIFSKQKYGDMDAFVQKLYDMGYEKVELLDTTDGLFIESKEAKLLMLDASKLLVGNK
ncbi:MAG: class I SAM-dependent methyltransferase [Clostridia bacterium]|nr:class I SAM-dependent methyltransferase [Clostridia bacterium]